MIEAFKELFTTNPTLAAVYSGGIFGLFIAYGKRTFDMIKNLLLLLFSFRISHITPVSRWSMSEQERNLHKILDNVKVLFKNSFEIKNYENNSDTEGVIGTGFGKMYCILNGSFCSVEKTRVEAGTTNEYIVEIVIRVFFTNKYKFLRRFCTEMENASSIYTDKIKIRSNSGSLYKTRRNLTSVYTNDNIGKELLSDVQRFLNNFDFYKRYNIPYKRNYLLYGKPGTGKTSLIFALASELNYKVQLMPLSSENEILNGLYEAGKNTIFVFEDIDCLSKLKERENNNSGPNTIFDPSNFVSLSFLLNIFDGLMCKEGSICFFTTNHINKLDKAFTRDGRMDVKLELTDLLPTTVKQMVKELTDLDCEPKKDFNPASLQELIMSYNTNKITAVEFLKIVNCK